MKSSSERTFGARIGNAEKLVTALQSFTNYQPIKPEFSISELNASIAQIKNQNITVANKKQVYSLSVETRHQLFEKNPFSIKKILSPINASVKASYGKEAKEATDVAAIIAKIRGVNSKTKKTLEQGTVSQSYRSFSSTTQFFSDLITNLIHFGTNYNPSNTQFIIANLETLHANATAANNLVMDSYSQFKQNNDNRIDSYNNFSQIAIRVKDSVKSQYGIASSEYRLIKGLVI